MPMSAESLPVPRLVLLALAEGYLSPEQAMETCLAYGQSIEESEPFEVERYWLRLRWMTPAEIEQLVLHHAEWSLFQAPRTRIEDTAVLLSIQHLLQRQHETPSQPQWSQPPLAEDVDTTDDFGLLEGTDYELPVLEEQTEADTDGEEPTDADDAPRFEPLATQGEGSRHTLHRTEGRATSDAGRPDASDANGAADGDDDFGKRPFQVEDTELFSMPSMPGVIAGLRERQLTRARTPQPSRSDFDVAVTVGSAPSWDEAPQPMRTAPRWSLHDAFSVRYDVKKTSEELGRSGEELIYDRNLERHVLRKSQPLAARGIFHDGAHFVLEMRLLGQLEHPAIPKVYDLLLHQRSAHALLPELPQVTLSHKLAVGELSLAERVRILRRVCEGLSYAHGRGIVHCQVTPGNILLGEDGEVYLVGWRVDTPEPPVAEQLRSMLARDDATIAQRQGDPRYMAPEWLSHGAIGPEVDQYAMGVLLYRCLTGTYPFAGGDTFALLYQIHSLALTSPHQRTPERHIPDLLASMCMRMLARDPAARFGSMKDVLRAFDQFEADAFGAERREQTANALYAEGRLLAEQLMEINTQADDLARKAQRRAQGLDPWADASEKEKLWSLEARLAQHRKEASILFGAATQKYLKALEHAPQHGLARRGLAALFWHSYLQAEARQDAQTMRFCLDMLALYDDGHYTSQSEGTVEVALELQEALQQLGAEGFVIERYEEKHRRLQPVEAAKGDGDTMRLSLPPGSYLLREDAEEARLKVPFVVERGRPLKLALALPTQGEGAEAEGLQGPDGCQLILGGEVVVGGDVDAPASLPEQRVALEDFWLSAKPVTFTDYLAFLNDIHSYEPTAAREIIPRVEGREAFVKLNAEGRYIPNRKTLLAGPIAAMYPAAERASWSLPVFGVTWFDALLYCRWLTKQRGYVVTLPTEPQWERAAAGADRRPFPWGHGFDPSFCKMGLSRPRSHTSPEPVGTFSIDVSPFGVCDLAGGVRDWCMHMPREEADLLDGCPSSPGVVRGGCWRDTSALDLRIGARRMVPCDQRSRDIGFRVVEMTEMKLPLHRGQTPPPRAETGIASSSRLESANSEEEPSTDDSLAPGGSRPSHDPV